MDDQDLFNDAVGGHSHVAEEDESYYFDFGDDTPFIQKIASRTLLTEGRRSFEKEARRGTQRKQHGLAPPSSE